MGAGSRQAASVARSDSLWAMSIFSTDREAWPIEFPRRSAPTRRFPSCSKVISEREVKKMAEYKTSTGVKMLLEFGGFLTHSEFRLLFALSDYPCEASFQISEQDAICGFGFADFEIDSVVDNLNRKSFPIGLFKVTKDGGLRTIVWTLP